MCPHWDFVPPSPETPPRDLTGTSVNAAPPEIMQHTRCPIGLLQLENKNAPLTQSRFVCSERQSVTEIFLHSFATQKHWRTHNLSDAICRFESEEKEDVCKEVPMKRRVRHGHICHSFSFQVKRYMLKTSCTCT